MQNIIDSPENSKLATIFGCCCKNLFTVKENDDELKDKKRQQRKTLVTVKQFDVDWMLKNGAFLDFISAFYNEGAYKEQMTLYKTGLFANLLKKYEAQYRTILVWTQLLPFAWYTVSLIVWLESTFFFFSTDESILVYFSTEKHKPYRDVSLIFIIPGWFYFLY